MRTSSVEKISLDTLSREQAHLTSQQVYQQIRARLPAVNHSTVYRALERMVDRGILSVSDMGSGAAVYEVVAEGLHHHLVCQQCGKVVTVGDEDVQNFFSVIKEKSRFVILTNHLILFGHCETCQRAEDS